MGYIVFAPRLNHADGGWRLEPKDMSGHEFADFIRRYFPDIRITSTREYAELDAEAQIEWQTTGKMYMHDIVDDVFYRSGFYLTDDDMLLPDEFFEDCPVLAVTEEDTNERV